MLVIVLLQPWIIEGTSPFYYPCCNPCFTLTAGRKYYLVFIFFLKKIVVVVVVVVILFWW